MVQFIAEKVSASHEVLHVNIAQTKYSICLYSILTPICMHNNYDAVDLLPSLFYNMEGQLHGLTIMCTHVHTLM